MERCLLLISVDACATGGWVWHTCFRSCFFPGIASVFFPVPGIAFGMENFFRISYATSEIILEEAGSRIVRACKQLV